MQLHKKSTLKKCTAAEQSCTGEKKTELENILNYLQN